MPVVPLNRLQGWAAQKALGLFDAKVKPGETPFAQRLSGMSPAAMKNLLAVSRAATVEEEVEIFVRYQAARNVFPPDAAIALRELRDMAIREAGGGDPLPHLRALLGQISRLHSATAPRVRS